MAQNDPVPVPEPPASKARAWLYLLGFLVAGIGFVMIAVPLVNAFNRSRLGAEVSDTPEDLTLERLLARGLSGNPYVRVTQFRFRPDVVTLSKLGRWEQIWVPVQTARGGGKGEGGGSFGVIVKSKKVHSQADLDELTARQEITGLLINVFESLSGKERELLKERYPATDFDRVLILEADRKPPTGGNQAVLYIVGAVVFGLGVALCYFTGFGNLRRVLAEEMKKSREKRQQGGTA
jgi:hypothetical protein